MIESKQAYDLSKEQLEQEKEKYEKLAIELKEMKSTESRSKKELSGNLSFELELQQTKKDSEELVKELAEEKKAHETLR